MMSPRPDLPSPATPRSTQVLHLRPGGGVFEISPEQLQISFPNHTATFQGVPVAKGIRALLPLLEVGGPASELAARAAEQTGLQPAFLEYLLDLLAGANCLYEETDPAAAPHADGPLAQFYASVGHDPGRELGKLAAARPVVAAPLSRRASLTESMRAAGISAEFVDIVPGTSCAAVLSSLKQMLRDPAGTLVSWGLPYRSPIARLINDLALELGTPVLFGSCEGLTGRIGPYVIPKNTACLECFNNRVLANSGIPERIAYAQYRARHTDTIEAPWPAHPLFHAAVERLFVLELSQILLDAPPRTIAAVVEYSFAEGSVVRHPVYRVPRCEACHPPKPPRIPWDVKFPAPVVKGGGE